MLAPTAIVVDDDPHTTLVFSELLKILGLNVVALGYNGKKIMNHQPPRVLN